MFGLITWKLIGTDSFNHVCMNWGDLTMAMAKKRNCANNNFNAYREVHKLGYKR